MAAGCWVYVVLVDKGLNNDSSFHRFLKDFRIFPWDVMGRSDLTNVRTCNATACLYWAVLDPPILLIKLLTYCCIIAVCNIIIAQKIS